MEHCLKYVWTLRDEATCWIVSHLWNQKLSLQDRKLASITALLSLEPEEAFEVASYVCERLQFGSPLPPLGSIKDEAAWWASRATEDELRYYLTAIFLNLPSKMKSEFSSYARDFCEERAVA